MRRPIRPAISTTRPSTSQALVLMTAKRQGAENSPCLARLQCLEREVRHLGGVWYQDPMLMTFLWDPSGGTSACRYTRFTPRFRLPKAFPENKRDTQDPVLTNAAAINNAPSSCVRRHHCAHVEVPGRHGQLQAHDPNSFSYSDSSAKKVGCSPKGNGPEQGRQDPETAGTFIGGALLWRIGKKCSGLTQKAKPPQTQPIRLSWWEFRPGSSKSANCKPPLQLPSSCLQIVK